MKELLQLSKKCWRAFCEAKSNPILNSYLINGTMPILYFGDMNSYFSSKLKIITVALNPSDGEFYFNKDTRDFSYARFPKAEFINKYCSKDLDDESCTEYLNSLNEYFKTGMDYKRWFNNKPRQNLFSAFDASYYDTAPNRVLHTDLQTPFPTYPTWSKIKEHVQNEFCTFGIELWYSLLEILDPDIIFMSLNKSYIQHQAFYKTFSDYIVYDNKKSRAGEPLKIQHGYISLNSGKKVHIFNESRTNCVPFNSLGNEDALLLSKKIYNDYVEAVL